MFTRIAHSIRTLLAALLTAALIAFTLPATAATTNYSLATPGILVLPFHFDGQFTATTNPVAEFKMPFAANLIGMSGTCRASGGTSPTLTIDLEDDGTSVLSSAFSVTAGTVAEGTIDTASVADESVMEIVFTITGTSPTWDDCTVLITLQRQ